eukprot:6469585-Amphidinium_carterae.1
MDPEFLALGVIFDCADTARGVLRIANKPERVNDICGMLRALLSESEVAMADLLRLRGKLGFALAHVA